ncbi:MAG: Gfo/Idh/MocA family oxidoreductase [Clostridia bacterium]|nr:Gfo/Idh/MocA family oxidoreductase [Clostridia bacterium]
MSKIIQVGIAGFGMSGQIFHGPFLHVNPKFNIKKVYERSGTASRKEYGYSTLVRHFEELLEDDIDLVVISTPNVFHYEMAKEAILHKKHVVVEKPVTITAQEAKHLKALAEANHVLLTVYQSRRLDSDFLTVKSIIESKALGELVDYEAHFDRFVQGVSSKKWKAEGGVGVNILYDLGVHIIDQAYTLFGMPNEIYADFRKQREETAEFDHFHVTLYYDHLKAILSAGQVVLKKGPHYTLHGTKGSFVKYGMDVQENDLIAGKRPQDENWGKEPEAIYGTLTTMDNEEINETLVESKIGNYGSYYDNIYDVLVKGASPLVSMTEAIDVLKIIEASIQSNVEKRRIQIEKVF